MIEFDLASQQPSAALPSVPVTVIGVGGAGTNILDSISLEGMPGARLVAINTDARALQSSMLDVKLQLGHDLTRGLGAGGDPDLGAEAARASAADIREELQDQKLVFLCTGLGGGTGSGAAPLVAEMAREAGAFVVVFAVMPFNFEGRRRLRQAEEALEALRGKADALITFDNDRLGELVLPKKGIHDAFAAGDKVVGQSIRSLILLVTQPGLIRIGLDELISAVGRGDRRCLFGHGSAKGEQRIGEALTAALKSPLLHKGELRERGRDVLVHISGGPDLSFAEVQELMQELNKHLHEDAKILFGAGVDPTKGDQISLTILTSLGRNEKEEEPPAVESPVATAAPTPAAPPAPIAPTPAPAAVAPPQAAPVATAVPAPAPVAPVPPAAPAPQEGEIILDVAPEAPTQTEPVIEATPEPFVATAIAPEPVSVEAVAQTAPVAPAAPVAVPEPVPAAPTAFVEVEPTVTATSTTSNTPPSLDDKALAFAKKFEALDAEIQAQQQQHAAPAPAAPPPPARPFKIRDLSSPREPVAPPPAPASAAPAQPAPARPTAPASSRGSFFQSWHRAEAQRGDRIEYEDAGSVSEFDPPVRPAPARPAAPRENGHAEPPMRQWNRHREPSQTSFENNLRTPGAALTNHGRFENIEPTIEDGEDLDVPTFMRRKP